MHDDDIQQRVRRLISERAAYHQDLAERWQRLGELLGLDGLYAERVIPDSYRDDVTPPLGDGQPVGTCGSGDSPHLGVCSLGSTPGWSSSSAP